jgi:hypothetical protein
LSMSAALGAVPRTGLSASDSLRESDDEDRSSELRLSAIPMATIPPVTRARAT